MNMRSPKLYIAAKSSCLSEQIFILDCNVAERTAQIFLEPKKVGSGAYLLGKLTAAGISIFAPAAKAKDYARRLIGLLVENGIRTVIPDEPGWIEMEEGKYAFVNKGRMTWKEIVGSGNSHEAYCGMQ